MKIEEMAGSSSKSRSDGGCESDMEAICEYMERMKQMRKTDSGCSVWSDTGQAMDSKGAATSVVKIIAEDFGKYTLIVCTIYFCQEADIWGMDQG